MEARVNTPPPVVEPEITIDLIGLSEAQAELILKLIGNVRTADVPDAETGEMYAELARALPPHKRHRYKNVYTSPDMGHTILRVSRRAS